MTKGTKDTAAELTARLVGKVIGSAPVGSTVRTVERTSGSYIEITGPDAQGGRDISRAAESTSVSMH